jgi:hypothetical protein
MMTGFDKKIKNALLPRNVAQEFDPVSSLFLGRILDPFGIDVFGAFQKAGKTSGDNPRKGRNRRNEFFFGLVENEAEKIARPIWFQANRQRKLVQSPGFINNGPSLVAKYITTSKRG